MDEDANRIVAQPVIYPIDFSLTAIYNICIIDLYTIGVGDSLGFVCFSYYSLNGSEVLLSEYLLQF